MKCFAENAPLLKSQRFWLAAIELGPEVINAPAFSYSVLTWFEQIVGATCLNRSVIENLVHWSPLLSRAYASVAGSCVWLLQKRLFMQRGLVAVAVATCAQA